MVEAPGVVALGFKLGTVTGAVGTGKTYLSESLGFGRSTGKAGRGEGSETGGGTTGSFASGIAGGASILTLFPMSPGRKLKSGLTGEMGWVGSADFADGAGGATGIGAGIAGAIGGATAGVVGTGGRAGTEGTGIPAGTTGSGAGVL